MNIRNCCGIYCIGRILLSPPLFSPRVCVWMHNPPIMLFRITTYAHLAVCIDFQCVCVYHFDVHTSTQNKSPILCVCPCMQVLSRAWVADLCLRQDHAVSVCRSPPAPSDAPQCRSVSPSTVTSSTARADASRVHALAQPRRSPPPEERFTFLQRRPGAVMGPAEWSPAGLGSLASRGFPTFLPSEWTQPPGSPASQHVLPQPAPSQVADPPSRIPMT